MPEWTMTGNDRERTVLRKEAKDEVRVVLPMNGWEELGYLVDDSTEDPTDLPTVLLLAWEASADVP